METGGKTTSKVLIWYLQNTPLSSWRVFPAFSVFLAETFYGLNMFLFQTLIFSWPRFLYTRHLPPTRSKAMLPCAFSSSSFHTEEDLKSISVPAEKGLRCLGRHLDIKPPTDFSWLQCYGVSSVRLHSVEVVLMGNDHTLGKKLKSSESSWTCYLNSNVIPETDSLIPILRGSTDYEGAEVSVILRVSCGPALDTLWNGPFLSENDRKSKFTTMPEV